MNRRYMSWLCFGLALLLGFGVPISLVLEQERILDEGLPVKLRTRPVDPYDPFRGRYVRLGFQTNGIPLADGAAELAKGDKTYLSLEIDASGYGSFGLAHSTVPATGPYLTAEVMYLPPGNTVFARLSFDRYYMNERIAPEAERLYEEANRRRVADASGAADAFLDGNYALVRIRKGSAAIEGVYLDHQPIEQFVRMEMERVP